MVVGGDRKGDNGVVGGDEGDNKVITGWWEVMKVIRR